MLLQHAFERTASRLPSKVALVSGGRRVAYAELLQRVDHLAAMLATRGVAPGDRVALLLENDVDYAVAVHAVLRCGAVFVPLTTTTKADKLAFVLNDTEAVGLVAEDRLASVWSDMTTRCPALRVVLHAQAFEGGPATPAPAVDRIDQDLAALIYTSGSTGRPKGVMLTHHNMLSAWQAVQAYLGMRDDDVVGLAIPPTFSYGLYHLLMGLGLGATVVLERRAAFPVKMAETLARERVSLLPGVPTFWSALTELPSIRRFDTGALRLLTNAAAALPLATLARMRELWPQARILAMYGMTECKRISYLPHDDIDARPGSVGRGMPNQEHWLVDEQGRRLPHGSTGELVVRGSHVMRGYWRRPEETARALRPGPNDGERVLHTGDLFRSDKEGYLYFVSRTDDIIKTRGEKVAPREVEEAIHLIEGVTGCAVVGVPDAALGQAVKAFVTLRPGCELMPRDIVRHCLARLESHMAPKYVEVVESLPTTDSGKVLHSALRGS
ncbi:MAG: class I adenylate-forming enzyme family protein [Burkholderiaceae bacterium]